RDVELAAKPHRVPGEALKNTGLQMGDGPVSGRMEIPTLFGLEELGANRHGGLVQVETAHHVSRSRGVATPTRGQELVRYREPVLTGSDMGKTLEGQIGVIPGEVELVESERASDRVSVEV